MPVMDSTERFSSRVENYVRYRPGYPPEVIDLLKSQCGLKNDSIVADIAFGTGIFTKLLLEAGCRVTGVEPNAGMRNAGQQFLRAYPRFNSVNGTAEATGLADQSTDIVTAAQAAHWFNPKQARNEFRRILKHGGWTVLIWNDRRSDSSEFQRQYERLILQYGTDYREVRQQGTALSIEQFFAHSGFYQAQFQYVQLLEYEGLKGRLLSSSYAPQEGVAGHEPMLRDLQIIFDQHAVNGQVSLDYDTRVYYGQLE